MNNWIPGILIHLICLSGIPACTKTDKNQTVEIQEISSPLMRNLFPDGKPIGQPFSRFHTDIRIMRVGSYGEAYDWFASVCDRDITLYTDTLSQYRYYRLRYEDGFLIFTDKVNPDTHEVAVLLVFSDSVINKGISEIRFVETIKIR